MNPKKPENPLKSGDPGFLVLMGRPDGNGVMRYPVAHEGSGTVLADAKEAFEWLWKAMPKMDLAEEEDPLRTTESITEAATRCANNVRSTFPVAKAHLFGSWAKTQRISIAMLMFVFFLKTGEKAAREMFLEN